MKYSFIHVCSTVLINQQKSRVEKHYKVRVMPGFHHSVTVLPLSILQFVHTVQPMSMVQPILPYICFVTEAGKMFIYMDERTFTLLYKSMVRPHVETEFAYSTCGRTIDL